MCDGVHQCKVVPDTAVLDSGADLGVGRVGMGEEARRREVVPDNTSLMIGNNFPLGLVD